MNVAAVTCPTRSPEDAMKDLTFVLRSDLHVSRQVHQGQPVYVVHDPVSFIRQRSWTKTLIQWFVRII